MIFVKITYCCQCHFEYEKKFKDIMDIVDILEKKNIEIDFEIISCQNTLNCKWTILNKSSKLLIDEYEIKNSKKEDIIDKIIYY